MTHHVMSLPMAQADVQIKGGGGEKGGKPPKQQFRLDKSNWPGVMLASVVLGLLTQAIMHRDAMVGRGDALLHLQGEATPGGAAPLEVHLAGCRTKRTDPIPKVNTSAWMAVLETWSPRDREVADNFTDAVAACESFECLQRANELPRAPGQFRYPHFFILGFPKCATTSVYCHLIQHPQVQHPLKKEPHTLMYECRRPGMECPPEVQRQYVQDVLNMGDTSAALFTKAAFDGSTHYAAEGTWLAGHLAATFPWARVMISMRDPISQALSMHLHNLHNNRTIPCFEDNGRRIYSCVVDDLESADRARYGPKVAAWLRHFPRTHLLLLQYESLITEGSMQADLAGIKSFLGLTPGLPSDVLPLSNWKHLRGKSPDTLGRYWNMTQTEYKHLISLARRNTKEVVDLLEEHGHADAKAAKQWLHNWEGVWERNLETCEGGPQGNCKVVVS